MSDLRDGDLVWVCNWFAHPPHGPHTDPPRVAARVVGDASGDVVTTKPIWGSICEKCAKDTDEFGDDTQPDTIEVPVKGELTNDSLSIQKMDPTNVEGKADMIDLADLQVGELMHNLRIRYQQTPMEIYTYVGDILIVMNPMQDIGLTKEEVKAKYVDRKLGDPSIPPHVFAIADEAHRELLESGVSQGIVISGESGAGKSESTKHVLEYLSYVSAKKGGGAADVNAKIIATSEVLEAFGNAKTKRNHNSSRFGKFVTVQFNSKGAILGAEIVQYLLEKSRIVTQEEKERNYHIFYMMVSQMSADEKKELGLTKVEDYRFLIGPDGVNKKDWSKRPDGVTDLGDDERWVDFLKYCKELEFTDDLMKSMFRIIAAVLHLGQITFKGGGQGPVEITNPETLDRVADLLKLDKEKLDLALRTQRIMKTRKNFDEKQAYDNIDAIAKAIYGQLFVSLVEDVINKSIHTLEESNWIGVLDIFGFETFQNKVHEKKGTYMDTKNKFEQLCINLTNEQLQHFFYNYLIPEQIKRYQAEGLDIKEIYWDNNQPCLDMCMGSGRKSLFYLLNDSTKKATTNVEMKNDTRLADQDWLEGIKRVYNEGKKAEQTFLEPKERKTKETDFVGVLPRDPKFSRDKTDFVVYHYAGKVWYTVDGAVERNKDKISDDSMEVLSGSKDEWLAGMFVVEEKKGGKPAKVATVATHFKESLHELIVKLESTHPFFVRCVKPNCIMKKGGYVEDHKVLDQLLCAGMTAVIDLRKSGYPVERTPQQIVDQFGLIEMDKSKLKAAGGVDAQCKYLCKKVEDEYKDEVKNQDGHRPWAMGHTKMFFKDKMYKAMNKALRKAELELRKLQTFSVEAVKSLFLMRRDLQNVEKKRERYRVMKDLLVRKRQLIREGMSPEEADQRMQQEKEELEARIEAEYRAHHYQPLQDAYDKLHPLVSEYVAAMDEFVSHNFFSDGRDAEEKSQWVTDVKKRRNTMQSCLDQIGKGAQKLDRNPHDEDEENSLKMLIEELQRMTSAEPKIMKKDMEKRTWEIENAELKEQMRREAARKEAERLVRVAQEEREHARLAAVEAEKQRRREEKEAQLNKKLRAKQAALQKQTEQWAEEHKRILEGKERVARQQLAEQERRRRAVKAKEMEQKRENAPYKAVVGTKVAFQGMLCEVRFYGPLPGQSDVTDLFLGLECPEARGQMNSGCMGSTRIMKCSPGRGKFVHPKDVLIVSPSKLTVDDAVTVDEQLWVDGTTMVGVVKHAGRTHFAAGNWIGLSLDRAGTGKNDGSIGGVRYFTALPKSGVFTRITKTRRAVPWTETFVMRAASSYCKANNLWEVSEDDDEDIVINERDLPPIPDLKSLLPEDMHDEVDP